MRESLPEQFPEVDRDASLCIGAGDGKKGSLRRKKTKEKDAQQDNLKLSCRSEESLSGKEKSKTKEKKGGKTLSRERDGNREPKSPSKSHKRSKSRDEKDKRGIVKPLQLVDNKEEEKKKSEKDDQTSREGSAPLSPRVIKKTREKLAKSKNKKKVDLKSDSSASDFLLSSSGDPGGSVGEKKKKSRKKLRRSTFSRRRKTRRKSISFTSSDDIQIVRCAVRSPSDSKLSTSMSRIMDLDSEDEEDEVVICVDRQQQRDRKARQEEKDGTAIDLSSLNTNLDQFHVPFASVEVTTEHQLKEAGMLEQNGMKKDETSEASRDKDGVNGDPNKGRIRSISASSPVVDRKKEPPRPMIGQSGRTGKWMSMDKAILMT